MICIMDLELANNWLNSFEGIGALDLNMIINYFFVELIISCKFD